MDANQVANGRKWHIQWTRMHRAVRDSAALTFAP